MRSGVVRYGLLAGVLGGAGCGFSSPASAPVVDAPPPGPDACVSFSAQLETCDLPLAVDVTLSGMVAYDTTRHVLTVAGAETPVASRVVPTQTGSVDAILARDLRIAPGTQLRATGELPLAIIAGGRVTVDDGALIDVSNGGAGARTACAGGPTEGAPSPGGAAGGGGGGFAGNGGAGGAGDDGKTAGGTAGVAEVTPRLGGGCPGAPGGKGDADGGAGGAAGGALYIVAAHSITRGTGAPLTAGGGGGGGGVRDGRGGGDAGGGGGGSGGRIVLEAPELSTARAVIVANGGGGGEGSSDQQAGAAGSNGTLSSDRAPGGAGGSDNGTDGGAGGSSIGHDGEPGPPPSRGAGGGGGGGIGFVDLVSTAAPSGATQRPE